MLATLRANIAATLLGLLAAVLLVITVVLTVQLHGFLWIDGANDKLADCARDRNELRAISTKKNEQAERTERNIDLSDKRIQIADKVAEKIEAAPLPGNCRTPDEVMREPRL